MIHHLTPHEWGATVPTMAARVETLGVFEDGICIGLACLRIKLLPFRAGGVAYISGGPLIRAGGSVDDLRRTLSALADEYVRKRRLVLRVVPPVEWVLVGWDCAAAFESLGFRPVHDMPPYRTIMVDLSADERDLHARLHPKWRNCLSAAVRNGVKVRVSSDDADLARFAVLHHELMRRK